MAVRAAAHHPVLPGGQEGPDLHPPRQRHQRKGRTSQLREAQDDRKGGQFQLDIIMTQIKVYQGHR